MYGGNILNPNKERNSLNEKLKTFIKWTEKKIYNIHRKFEQEKESNSLIDTTITVKTKDLLSENKKFFKKNNISLMLTLTTAFISAISIIKENINGFDYKKIDFTNNNTLMLILGIFLLILIFITFVSFLSSSSVKKFTNQIVKQQYDNVEYTAIFLVKTIIDNTPKILVSKSSLWHSYMLPYCHYDPKTEDINKPSAELHRAMSEYLEIPKDTFEIKNNFTVKTKVAIKRNQSHKGISRINYRFYYIKFKDPLIKNYLMSDKGNPNLIWKSKDELVKDSSTILNNGDVLTSIDELSLINQTPIAFPNDRKTSYEIQNKYRIIWNITNDCYYNCPICATNSGKNYVCDTSEDDKMKILMSIASINGHIEKLDISGGDPLKNKEDQNIIKLANKMFPYSSISITTTGEGLNNVDLSEFADIVKTCDITYDIPYKRCLTDCREYDYNLTNIRKIEGMRKAGIGVDFNIHVPIHEETIDEEIVRDILTDIKDIKPKEVKFIRLMPVGRASEKVSTSYSPDKFLEYVNKYKKELNIDFKMSLNCSLRVRSKNSKGEPLHKCKMLEEKIGIDHKGNVFTCIWGAYLKMQDDDITKNPFYIGNCIEKPLCDILTDKLSIKYFTNNYVGEKLEKVEPNGHYCRVCAYAKNNSINLEKDADDGLLLFENSLSEN